MAKQTKKPVSPHTWVWVDEQKETMNDTKQSSIEWLVEQLKPAITLQEKYINEFLQQAKAMHKEEIMDAFQHGKWDWDEVIKQGIPSKDPAEYYNEIFKGDK